MLLLILLKGSPAHTYEKWRMSTMTRKRGLLPSTRQRKETIRSTGQCESIESDGLSRQTHESTRLCTTIQYHHTMYPEAIKICKGTIHVYFSVAGDHNSWLYWNLKWAVLGMSGKNIVTAPEVPHTLGIDYLRAGYFTCPKRATQVFCDSCSRDRGNETVEYLASFLRGLFLLWSKNSSYLSLPVQCITNNTVPARTLW